MKQLRPLALPIYPKLTQELRRAVIAEIAEFFEHEQEHEHE
ncbi:MAG TPA: hypothetical protein VGI85_11520 [Chthoniobacterales bacterium]